MEAIVEREREKRSPIGLLTPSGKGGLPKVLKAEENRQGAKETRHLKKTGGASIGMEGQTEKESAFAFLGPLSQAKTIIQGDGEDPRLLVIA